MAAGDDDIIDSVAVRVSPDLTGFRAKLTADLEKALKGVEATVKVKLVADRTGFGKSIKEKVAEQQGTRGNPTFKVKLRADRTGFITSVRAELAKVKEKPTLKVKLIADRSELAGAGGGTGGGGGNDTRRTGGGGSGGGGDEGNGFSLPPEDAKRDAAYLLRLRQNSIQQQLVQTRNGNEMVQRAEQASYNARFARLRSFQEGVQRAEAAARDAEFNRTRTRAEQLQRDELAAVRVGNKEKQREDEQYLRFVDHINSELTKIRRGAADDEIRIHHETQQAHENIDRQGQRLRVTLLEAAGKIERDVIQRAERDDRESTQRRIARSAQLRRQLLGALSPKLINFGGEGIRPINLLYASLLALVPVLVSVGSSAVLAASSIASLGAAGIGAAVAVTGLAVSFGPVINALKLRKSVLNTEAQQTANSAKINAQDAAARERVKDATDALIKAQGDERDSQLAINKARQQAKRDLQDLRRAVIDLRNEERSDRLSVAEAKDKQDATARNFFSSHLDRLRADQDVRDAETRLQDTLLKQKRNNEDLAAARTKGVEGSDPVVAAKRQLADAKRNLALARQKPLPSETVASPEAQLREQIKKMAPAAREMYYIFHDNEKVFTNLQKSIQQKVLPGFNLFLRDVLKVGKDGKSSLSIFADAAGELGSKAGDLAARLGKLTQTGWFRNKFKTIIDNNSTAMDHLVNAAVALVKPLLTIFADSSPLLVRFAAWIERIATQFAGWIEQAHKTGQLQDFFHRAGDEMARWGGLAREILGLLKGIFTASAPAGGTIVDSLTGFFASANTWVQTNQARLTQFFDDLANLPWADIRDGAVQIAGLFAASIGVKWALMHKFWAAVGLVLAHNPGAAQAVLDKLYTWTVAFSDFLAKHENVVYALLGIIGAVKAKSSFNLLFKVIFGERGSRPTNPLFVADVSAGGALGLLAKIAGALGVTSAVAGGSIAAILSAAVVSALGAGLGIQNGLNGKTPADNLADAINDPSFGNITKAILTNTVGQLPNQITLAWTEGFDGWLKSNQEGGKKFRNRVREALGLPPLPEDKPTDPNPNPDPSRRTGGGSFGLDAGNENPNVNTGGTVLLDPPKIPYRQNNGNLPDWVVSPPRAAMKAEADSYSRLQNLANQAGPGLGPARKAALQDYIAKRKKAVTDYVEYVRSTKGPIAAEQALQTENQRSETTLKKIATQLGLSKTEVGKYTKAITDVPQVRNTEIDTPGLQPAIHNMSELKTKIDAVTGKKVITMVVDGQQFVFPSLQEALTYQTALQRGITLDAARQRLKLEKEGTQSGQYVHGATGGFIRGPGGPTSDDVPAWLSNGEYVLREKAVRKIGVQRLDMLNRAGGYAAGGLVGGTTWPFPVDISKTMIPMVAGPGQARGDLNVARIAEATARGMGASDKQLLALIEAGLVESGLRNLDYGDRDSVGFLQQRASWGSKSARMNIAAATRKFINKARKVDTKGYTPGQLAQAVQVSAFPDRYDQRYADAVAVLNLEAPFLTGMGLGTAVGGRGWRWQEAVLKAAFGKQVQFFSTTGGKHARNSLHYAGRALDLTPSMQIYDWIRQHYGANTLELIYGPAGIGIKNGKPYNFGKTLNAQHMNHIHWAFSKGGPVRKYDTGGVLPPGYTLAYNGTGRNETVRTQTQERQMRPGLGGQIRLDRRDMATIASYIAGAASPTVQMDGRKVAEVTNRYTYLPAGV